MIYLFRGIGEYNNAEITVAQMQSAVLVGYYESGSDTYTLIENRYNDHKYVSPRALKVLLACVMEDEV
jgi:hypothetical protein